MAENHCAPYENRAFLRDLFAGRDPQTVTMHDLLDAFVERVLALLGRRPGRTWEDIR